MAQDEASIEAFFDGFADVWKANDGSALGELFTEDGSLVNPFGARVDGRSDVSSMYNEYFRDGMLLHGTTTEVRIERIRSLNGNGAFVDATQTIYGDGGNVVLAVNLVALLRRSGDRWQFVDSRPYAPMTQR